MALRIVIDIDTEAADINDLYLARGVLRMIDQGYQEEQIESPEYIVDKLNLISTEIRSRNKAELQKRLKLAKNRMETLQTRDERKSKLETEIAKLEEKLK